MVESKDLYEITTEEELRRALTKQCSPDVPMQTRIRKAFGGTQTAAIRLPVDAANQLMKTGKIQVGRSINTLSLRELQNRWKDASGALSSAKVESIIAVII